MPITQSILNYFNIYVRKLEVFYAEDLDFIKTKTKDIALSAFRTCNSNVPQRLSKAEFDVLKNQIYRYSRIQDKYIKRMENFLIGLSVTGYKPFGFANIGEFLFPVMKQFLGKVND